MKRYEKFEVNTQPVVFRTTIYPHIPASEDDIYIITRDSDRLDLLAGQYYEDVTLWWVIATANNLGKGSLTIPQEMVLRIPVDPHSILNKVNNKNNGY